MQAREIERLNSLYWLLEDQTYDLTTPIACMRNHIESDSYDHNSKETLGLYRMCNHSLIISLSKLYEILEKHKSEIGSFSADLGNKRTVLAKEIKSKGIIEFRNKYAAHIFDKGDKLISLEEGKERLNKIIGNDVEGLLKFYNWIFPETGQYLAQSVLHTVKDLQKESLTKLGKIRNRP